MLAQATARYLFSAFVSKVMPRITSGNLVDSDNKFFPGQIDR